MCVFNILYSICIGFGRIYVIIQCLRTAWDKTRQYYCNWEPALYPRHQHTPSHLRLTSPQTLNPSTGSRKRERWPQFPRLCVQANQRALSISTLTTAKQPSVCTNLPFNTNACNLILYYFARFVSAGGGRLEADEGRDEWEVSALVRGSRSRAARERPNDTQPQCQK